MWSSSNSCFPFLKIRRLSFVLKHRTRRQCQHRLFYKLFVFRRCAGIFLFIYLVHHPMLYSCANCSVCSMFTLSRRCLLNDVSIICIRGTSVASSFLLEVSHYVWLLSQEALYWIVYTTCKCQCCGKSSITNKVLCEDSTPQNWLTPISDDNCSYFRRFAGVVSCVRSQKICVSCRLGIFTPMFFYKVRKPLKMK